MDLTHILLNAFWRPNFIFEYEQLWSKEIAKNAESTTSSPWDSSPLNPKNRINSLDSTKSRWRVDGATVCGTRFFASPVVAVPNLSPLRIDIYLPDQEDHASSIRDALDSHMSVVLRHPRAIANLGISHHLCRALDNHCHHNPQFLHEYQKLPFGSKLLFEHVTADVTQMKLSIIRANDVERRSRSLAVLKSLWKEDVPEERWPEVIDIEHLQLVQQLHDSISLVRVKNCRPPVAMPVIFKSNVDDLEWLYHELKFLLVNPPHPNIMSSPLHVVTKKCNFGGKHGVFGFTLPYYPLGSIRDILPVRVRDETLSYRRQVTWCKQITSALIHIRERAGTFYSDLRPDNVLLSADTSDCEGNVVLIDFEQRGNWHEWCAPEVLFCQYVENLRSSRLAHQQLSDRWSKLMAEYPHRPSLTEKDGSEHLDLFEKVVRAKNCAWFSLSPESQEKAQVYSLGLFIYCIFEGLSNVRVSIANAYPCEPDVEFPRFKRTPPALQDIIKRCTIDAPEWTPSEECFPPRPRRVVRIGSKLYPECFAGTDAAGLDLSKEVLNTGLEWWLGELTRAETFLDSNEWQSGNFGKDRPSLREVFHMLELLD